MLISIDGIIFDTNQIYKITPITYNKEHEINLKFTIHFYNKDESVIEKSTNCFWLGFKFGQTPLIASYSVNGEILETDDVKTGFGVIENSETFKLAFKKMEDARNDLIYYWESDHRKIVNIEI